MRGRLGKGCEGPNEIRILNRIVRIAAQGLRYEADPRHCDLLIPSLGLQNGSAVKTPGVKPTDIEAEAPKGEEGEQVGQVIDSKGNVYSITDTGQPGDDTGVNHIKTLEEVMGDDTHNGKMVMIMTEPTDIFEVTPYSEIYLKHPRLVMATAHGMVRVP